MRKLAQIIVVLLVAAAPLAVAAQCAYKNTAFKSGEFLSYNLYYNWKFVWVKAGTASMSTVSSSYKGRQAYRASLTTRGNGRVDNMFVLRDTLLCYSTHDLVPLYYRKGAREGKRYTVDEIWYSYRAGQCVLRQQRLHSDGRRDVRTASSHECVYDMMNIFLRARSFSIEGWRPGHIVSFPIADGNGTAPARLKYRGKKTVKADNGVRYRCIELSYMEKEKGKWKEIVRFYVTDDDNHVPVRLDMFLRFGSAKAFLTNMKGLRSSTGAVVK